MNNKILQIIVGVLILIIFGSFQYGKMSYSVEESIDIINEKVNIDSIDISEFKEKLLSEYTLIDIRTLEELEETRLENIDVHLDFYSNNFKTELSKLDKNKKYLIYCRSGYRTGKSLNIMSELGFKEVYDLNGGINTWINMGEKTINGKIK